MGDNSKGRCVVGVDVGGTKLHSIVTRGSGKVIGTARKKSKPERGFKGVMERVVQVVADACGEAGIDLGQVDVVGVGAPSPVLPDGTAVNAPNMGWKDAPLGKTLSRMLGKPVFAANDCNAGTYGEVIYGAAKGARSAVGLLMGTGLGGGIVVDGRLVAGDNHQAAEVGHMVVSANGRRCGCGHRGCLEAYASKTGIGRRITHEVVCEGRQTMLTEMCHGDYANIRSGILAEAYALNDPLAVESLHEAADFLGIGVGNMITLLGPEVVVLGGGVFEAMGDKLLSRVREAARAVTFPPRSFEDTAIKLAALGDDAVALGAAAWAAQMPISE